MKTRLTDDEIIDNENNILAKEYKTTWRELIHDWFKPEHKWDGENAIIDMVIDNSEASYRDAYKDVADRLEKILQNDKIALFRQIENLITELRKAGGK